MNDELRWIHLSEEKSAADADEILKSSGIFDDTQSKITNAEVMTIALTAGYFFYGHQRYAFSFLIDYGYMGYPISESRFNRKLHLIPEEIWHTLFAALAQYFKENHDTGEYVADSFPVPVCDNIRIFKSKLISGEEFRGYTAR